jgi:5-methyltetrahydrofolate--homocysteine methyltransferase
MSERILVLDGAMGTMLQAAEMGPDDFGGAEMDGCNEILVETRPDVVLGVHRAYIEAGADIIETNTFGGTPIVLAEFGLAERTVELNRRAAELARQVADQYSGSGRPRFVAGSIGPTTKAISVTGGVTFGELVEAFALQARGLLEGGVDLFLVETCQDTRNTKAALIAVDAVCSEADLHRPTMVSCTIEPQGTMLAGQGAEAFAISLDHFGLLGMGLNCATGPEAMTDHLRSLHSIVPGALLCYPNAGMPDEDGRYSETPENLATALARFADHGWLNIVGGCCGTTDRHIAAIAAMVEGKCPRRIPAKRSSRVFFSGIDVVESTDDTRPLLVGERTNIIGSRKFKRLISEEKWEEAAEVARRQVADGAQIVDVCLMTTDRDELSDVEAFYQRLIRGVRAPVMIDSTDSAAIELALTYCQGRAIVNSINLEDGEKKFQEICPLLRRFGAAVVVGAIDEDPHQGMAFTRERKLEVIERSHLLLTTLYGLTEGDLIFDPLVFPVGSGDENYLGAAVETIEGLRLVKETFPRCRTILGISNVSFGLPPAAREVVNSVFLYHATRAGLDLAIVNTERLQRYATLDEAERQMAENLLFNRPPNEGTLALAPTDWRHQSAEQRSAINRLHVETIVGHFRGIAETPQVKPQLPLDERLSRYIVEGGREGLEADLRLKLDEGTTPLEIINGPLMSGMAEVGRLFNANQLIVAEVLRSAESMKAAVSFLEPFMPSAETGARGTLVLATVKGDVHDIGKNLVDIIISNNGYRVVNLGIKIGPEPLIEAVREIEPDAIGLSGLLVKSAQQMVATAEDLANAGIEIPILVGGAALSRRFVRSRIAPAYAAGVLYCSDAMAGLDAMNRLMDPAERRTILDDHSALETMVQEEPTEVRQRRRQVPVSQIELLPAPTGERRVQNLGLDAVWPFLNLQTLLGKHLGLRGSVRRKLAEGDPKALELHRLMMEVQSDARAWMRVRAVWKFFEAETAGNDIVLYEPGGEAPVHRLVFGRQAGVQGLCLADFVSGGQVRDSVAFFVVSAGEGVRRHAEEAKDAGEYLRSHALQALALETAEAAAEFVHARLRSLWGFEDPPEVDLKDLLAGRYRGKRFSPGYPAWPGMEDQRVLFDLLHPEEIGVELTEGMMMAPEASVSAMVLHHPEARYFSLGPGSANSG